MLQTMLQLVSPYTVLHFEFHIYPKQTNLKPRCSYDDNRINPAASQTASGSRRASTSDKNLQKTYTTIFPPTRDDFPSGFNSILLKQRNVYTVTYIFLR